MISRATDTSKESMSRKKQVSSDNLDIIPGTSNALHVAVARNDVNTIKKLMSHKKVALMLTSTDELDRTPLLLALTSSLADSVEAVLKIYAKTGTDVNAKDSNGNTVLHLACMSNPTRYNCSLKMA